MEKLVERRRGAASMSAGGGVFERDAGRGASAALTHQSQDQQVVHQVQMGGHLMSSWMHRSRLVAKFAADPFTMASRTSRRRRWWQQLNGIALQVLGKRNTRTVQIL